jgi:hypothetical protein
LGIAKGRLTPFVHGTCNDLTIGLFLEHFLERSMEKKVDFIVEGDVQNGPDHVHAYRTTAYVAGPYVEIILTAYML